MGFYGNLISVLHIPPAYHNITTSTIVSTQNRQLIVGHAALDLAWMTFVVHAMRCVARAGISSDKAVLVRITHWVLLRQGDVEIARSMHYARSLV